MNESIKKYVAEFIGTMVLVLFGCGTAVMFGCSMDDKVTVLVTALAFGLSIVAMAYCIGNVSGCHINPAVSLAVYLTGGMSAKDLGFYVLAQIAGAFAGSGLLEAIKGDAAGFGANSCASPWTGIVVEVILTFVFVLTILGVTSKKEFSSCAGIVIGLTLTFVHILGIPFTGTSVNPARSIAPAVLAGGEAFSQIWIFIVAPLAGAALAAGVWTLIRPKEA